MDVVKVESAPSIWRGNDQPADPFADIRRLGLEKNVAELDAVGYTLVDPDLVRAPGFAEELRDAVLRVAESQSGVRPDLLTGNSHRNLPTAAGQHMYYMLLHGRPFERAMMNETALALVSYLLGESCLFSSMTAMVKGPGKVKLDLHADMLMMPPPFPMWAAGCNATWILTPYSRENGSICFWPGSHKFCRQPTAAEREEVSSLVPIDAKPGSLLVWHTNTWHGAFARTAEGLRVNVIMYFCRPFMHVQEWYRDKFDQEVLKRNGERFARLIGLEQPFPMELSGPDRVKLARINAATRTQWG
ncbi:MAG TPA: phytanoyl-CoA dioxygenase family protein [Bradyrhizobium sp.]|nr:phytanoyl-CoA dioxygenase family protein [Bradyrhizobium sp.]